VEQAQAANYPHLQAMAADPDLSALADDARFIAAMLQR
jgi:hypothetical protein